MARKSLLPEVWRKSPMEERWLTPLREISQMQRSLDRIFDEFFYPPASVGTTEEHISFIPAYDLDETNTHYLVSLDLPGIAKDQINIELRDNQLIVSGERKEEKKKEEEHRLSSERYYGAFQRSFTLPSNVDPNKIEADHQNGVLHISIAKKEPAKSKVIKISEQKEQKAA